MKIVNYRQISIKIILALTALNFVTPTVALPSVRRKVVKPAVSHYLLPFALIMPPNPQSKWGIATIVPNLLNANGSLRKPLTPTQNAGLARFAKSQLMRSGRWSRFSVFVINDKKIAAKLLQLRAPSGNKTISRANAPALKRFWKDIAVYYELRNGKEYAFYPQRNPVDSWKALMK